MNVNTHKTETVQTRDEATDLQEYYESIGIAATWHKDVDGSYIVESWED